MYSIIRFTMEREKLCELEQLGMKMNEVRPGTFEGLRRRGDGFAVELLPDATWSEQRSSVLEFLVTLRNELSMAIALGARVTLDVAIEPEDYAHPGSSLLFDLHLVRELATLGVELEVTVY
jgi:hypothetical protein